MNSLNNVAINCTLVSGNHEEGIELLKEGILCLQGHGSIETSDAATIYTSISFIYQRMGQLEESLLWCRKALALRRKINGNTHQTTAKLITRLAGMLIIMKRYQEAQVLLERHLVDNKDAEGVGNDIEKTMQLLRDIYLKNGNRDKAGKSRQDLVSELVILHNFETEDKPETTKSATEDDVITTKSVNEAEDTAHLDTATFDSNTPASFDEECGFDDDGIDSDDDLYGPEDVSSQTLSRPHEDIAEQAHHDGNKEDAATSEVVGDEEDLYGSDTNPECMSFSATPESSVSSGNGYTTCVEITDEINLKKPVQQPLAKVKLREHYKEEQRQPKLHGPRSLQVSQQSAFMTVPKTATNRDNTVSRTQYHSLTQKQPVVQPSDNLYDNHSPTETGNVTSNFPDVKSSLSYRDDRSHDAEKREVQPSHYARREPDSLPATKAPNTYNNNRPYETFAGDTKKQPNNLFSNSSNQRTMSRDRLPGVPLHRSSDPFRLPEVPLRRSSDPFQSCQIGYQQYRPRPVFVQSLPYRTNDQTRNGREIVKGWRVSNEDRKADQWFEVRNSTEKPHLKSVLAGRLMLTPKQIEGSNNVLRLILGRSFDNYDHRGEFKDRDDNSTYIVQSK